MKAHDHIVDGLEELQGHKILHARCDAGGRTILQLSCGWVFHDASASWRPGAEELKWLSLRVAHAENDLDTRRLHLESTRSVLDAFEDAINAQESEA
jgi:hypothetical protein